MRKAYQKPEIELISLYMEEKIATGDPSLDMGESGGDITLESAPW